MLASVQVDLYSSPLFKSYLSREALPGDLVVFNNTLGLLLAVESSDLVQQMLLMVILTVEGEIQKKRCWHDSRRLVLPRSTL